MPDAPQDLDAPWWKSGVIYQIYVRSFADSNADGVGDLRGVIERLDHLEWLGVDAIWLSPVTVSPNADWGYDVADFRAVEPELGTIADLEELIAQAHGRDIRVLLDFVPNHTSAEHPWFVEARSERTAARREWYVWADPEPDGTPPNNWVSSFGGPAWTLDEASGQYYLHNHLSAQPDLNWWNEDLRDQFDDIVRFWFDHGIDGFRVDVCNVIVKDAELRDNPPATEEDPLDVQLFGQRPVYNANRPEVHDILRRWRRIADGYDPPRILLGETPVEDLAELGRYYGTALDELQLAFNFPFINAPFDGIAMPAIVARTEAALPDGAWPAWTGSNHDMSRLATRWAGDDPARIRAALLVLLTLRGTPVLYQGDEIGLGDMIVEPPDLRDPLGVRYWPGYAGRDAMRTPMHWRAGPGGGFTAASTCPWLPLGDTACNVEDQRADPASVLHLTRDLLGLRRRTADLHSGPYASLPGPDGLWVWRRGRGHVVAVSFAAHDATLDGCTGRVLIGTDRARDGEGFTGSLLVRASEGLVASVASEADVTRVSPSI